MSLSTIPGKGADYEIPGAKGIKRVALALVLTASIITGYEACTGRDVTGPEFYEQAQPQLNK